MRAKLFAMCFGWIFIVNYIVSSFVKYDSNSGLSVSSDLTSFSASVDDNWFNMSVSLIRTLFGALTFRIAGLPIIFSLFYWIPVIIIGFLILQFARGN